MEMNQTSIEHLTAESFDRAVTEHGHPVLVDFYADWCAPCHAIAPTLEELALEYAGRLSIMKVNVDEQPRLAARFEVRSIPTLLLFQNGRIVDRVVGVSAAPDLRRRLDAVA